MADDIGGLLAADWQGDPLTRVKRGEDLLDSIGEFVDIKLHFPKLCRLVGGYV